MSTTKIWTRSEIVNLLQRDNEFLKRALIKMYNRQTQLERDWVNTHCQNGVGLNKPDGHRLGSIAKFLLKQGYLSPKQIALVRARIMKYSSQITEIANSPTKS